MAKLSINRDRGNKLIRLEGYIFEISKSSSNRPWFSGSGLNYKLPRYLDSQSFGRAVNGLGLLFSRFLLDY